MTVSFIVGAEKNGARVAKSCKARTVQGAKRACVESYSVKQCDYIFVNECFGGIVIRTWIKKYHADWKIFS